MESGHKRASDCFRSIGHCRPRSMAGANGAPCVDCPPGGTPVPSFFDTRSTGPPIPPLCAGSTRRSRPLRPDGSRSRQFRLSAIPAADLTPDAPACSIPADRRWHLHAESRSCRGHTASTNLPLIDPVPSSRFAGHGARVVMGRAVSGHGRTASIMPAWEAKAGRMPACASTGLYLRFAPTKPLAGLGGCAVTIPSAKRRTILTDRASLVGAGRCEDASPRITLRAGRSSHPAPPPPVSRRAGAGPGAQGLPPPKLR